MVSLSDRLISSLPSCATTKIFCPCCQSSSSFSTMNPLEPFNVLFFPATCTLIFDDEDVYRRTLPHSEDSRFCTTFRPRFRLARNLVPTNVLDQFLTCREPNFSAHLCLSLRLSLRAQMMLRIHSVLAPPPHPF